MGGDEGVQDCKDHLLNLQEEYLQDELDRESLQKLAPTRVAQAEAEKKKVCQFMWKCCTIVSMYLMTVVFANWLKSENKPNHLILITTKHDFQKVYFMFVVN